MSLPRPFGPYELVRQLAVGGMAEVYLARARSVAGFEKPVALKMIHPRFSEDPEFARLLVEEANITAQLSHRNVVQVIDLGQIDGTHYIAMEYVDGLDLSRLIAKLRERGQLCSLRLAAFIVRDVCDGLEHAHRKVDAQGRPLKIVHRDVSPPNILLSTSGEVKLTDFGIAKAAMRAISTEAGVVKGKYAYMSPEQAKGQALDHRADVFAAGAVLYELVTAQPLYKDAPLPLLLDRVTKGVFEAPEKLRPDLPPQLAATIKKALAVNVADRYPSARAMADDLNAFLFTLAPNPEFELSQLLNTLLEGSRSSIAPMAGVSLFDDDSDDSTQIESMAVVRQKMAQPTLSPPKPDASGFTDEPTRALRRKDVVAGMASQGDEDDDEEMPTIGPMKRPNLAPQADAEKPMPTSAPSAPIVGAKPPRAIPSKPGTLPAPSSARVKNPGTSNSPSPAASPVSAGKATIAVPAAVPPPAARPAPAVPQPPPAPLSASPPVAPRANAPLPSQPSNATAAAPPASSTRAQQSSPARAKTLPPSPPIPKTAGPSMPPPPPPPARAERPSTALPTPALGQSAAPALAPPLQPAPVPVAELSPAAQPSLAQPASMDPAFAMQAPAAPSTSVQAPPVQAPPVQAPPVQASAMEAPPMDAPPALHPAPLPSESAAQALQDAAAIEAMEKRQRRAIIIAGAFAALGVLALVSVLLVEH